MKKATSNNAFVASEAQLRTATTKALAAEKSARAEKEKARLAKRRFKDARKVFKQAKKASKKALKLAARAQDELKACVDTVAKAKKRIAMLARRAAVQEATSTVRTTMGGSRRRPVFQKPKEPSTEPGSIPAGVPPEPAMDVPSSEGPTTSEGGLNS
jgi:hypothetical protein